MQKHRQLFISPQAKEDIQQAIDYYNSQQNGLGKKFHAAVKRTFSSIQKTPAFQVRYADVHCCPMRVFPFMVHYTLDEKNISVWGVVNMAREPEKYWKK